MHRILRVAASAVLLLTGCYTTTSIPPGQIASIERPLGAPKPVPGSRRLGPRTEIRARLSDGSVTTWVPAGHLQVGTDGLVTGRRHALATASEASLFEAGDGATELLQATAPPGGEVTPFQGRLRLRVSESRTLLPWIAAYATGAAMYHQPPGLLSFRDRSRAWESEPVPSARFARLSPAALAGVQVAEGIPWSDVERLELHNLDPVRTTAAVFGTPIGMSLMLLSLVVTAGAIANGDDPGPALALGAAVGEIATAEAAANADAEADTGGAPVRNATERLAVLVTPNTDDDTAGEALGATPLFSARARRRDAFKLVFAGDAGVTADGAFSGSAGAGFRTGDFLELTARVRSLPFDDAPAGLISDGSLKPPRHWLFGGRLAFHIDPDGDPRVACVIGAEVLGGALRDSGTLAQVGLLLGPRFGFRDTMFGSLLFAPSLLTWSGLPDHPAGTSGQVLFLAELGFDL